MKHHIKYFLLNFLAGLAGSAPVCGDDCDCCEPVADTRKAYAYEPETYQRKDYL